MSLGGVLYLLAGSIASLILARLVVGMGEGALYTAGATWAVDLAPVRHRGLALGLFGLAVWGGLSLGPLVGELLRSASGYNAVWVLTAVLPFVGALIALCLPEPARGMHGRVSERALALFPRPARRPGVALALANFGYAALAGFVILDLHSYGVSGGASVFTAFASPCSSAASPSAPPGPPGPPRDRHRRRPLRGARPGDHRLRALSRWALGGALVMGIGFSMMFPALALMVVGEVGEENRGSALGAFTAFFDIGVGLGAPLAGATAALAGYPAVFLLGAAAALGTAALAAFSPQVRLRPALATEIALASTVPSRISLGAAHVRLRRTVHARSGRPAHAPDGTAETIGSTVLCCVYGQDVGARHRDEGNRGARGAAARRRPQARRGGGAGARAAGPAAPSATSVRAPSRRPPSGSWTCSAGRRSARTSTRVKPSRRSPGCAARSTPACTCTTATEPAGGC